MSGNRPNAVPRLANPAKELDSCRPTANKSRITNHESLTGGGAEAEVGCCWLTRASA